MSPSSVIDKNVSPSHGSAKETLRSCQADPVATLKATRADRVERQHPKMLFRFSGKVDSFHEMHTTVADRINTAEIRD
jgi:hypothetical protein